MSAYRGIEYLREKLYQKSSRVDLRYRYYEMKVETSNRGFLIPPWLKGLYRSTIGWNAKAVDALADRLIFDGFEDGDVYDATTIFNANNPEVLFDSAIRESLIASCAFIQVAHGEGEENLPRLSVLTARDATGIMEESTGLLKEGYAILDRDEEGRPSLEAYFTPEGTQYYTNGKPAELEENPSRYPLLIPVVYKPSSKRPFGHSRISRSGMYLQQFAQNTMERAEVSAEFYSFPQKYITGLDPDADPLDTWKATMSSFLRFDKDEDGDHPVLGQFQQQTMSPYVEQLRMAASMFSGETGLTLDDLGFVTDNPTSAEAIKAQHETLRQIARRAQRTYTNAFRNLGYIAACVRDNTDYGRGMTEMMVPIWQPIFEPDAAMLSNIGDGAIKLNQAVPGFFDKDNIRRMTGIEGAEEPVGLEEEPEEPEVIPNE